jgi:hypothetical protein
MEKNNIEKLVEELKAVIPFKNSTEKGDIVLVITQDPQVLLYGIVTGIERDTTKKEEWWNIGVNFFTVPLQKVVWTLRTDQMTGKEIFTMGGEKRFFKAVKMEPETDRNKEKEGSSVTRKRPFMKRIK